MTSASYLEHYLDGLEQLPNELQRNFTLMRELDTRAQTLMKGIDEQANVFLSVMLKERDCLSETSRKEKLTKLQELFNKAKEYGDDKVQLAIQTYELVDKHIRRLDSDLARFEGEIQDKTLSTRCKSEETVGKRGRKKGKDTKSTGKRKRAPSSEDELRGNGGSNGGGGKGNTAGSGLGNITGGGMGNIISGGSQKVNKKPKVIQDKENRKSSKKTTDIEESLIDSSGLETTHPSDVLDMPVDPNEPTYCLCHQVSYGEMIGCDNPDCPIEWFHFACVGLTIKPKGKWFCPKCSQDRKKK